jgi:hypothetical protein
VRSHRHSLFLDLLSVISPFLEDGIVNTQRIFEDNRRK